MFGFGATRVDRYQDSPWFAQRIAENRPAGQEAAIGQFAYFRPSLVFYTDHPVEDIATAEGVPAFFAAHPGSAFVVTTDEHFDKFSSALPADVKVLDARPRFLHRGKVLLLGRPAPWSSTAAKTSDEPPPTRQ
jgi:hypothetical protein